MFKALRFYYNASKQGTTVERLKRWKATGKASPRPWRLDSTGFQILDAKGRPVAALYGTVMNAEKAWENARKICQAVNSMEWEE